MFLCRVFNNICTPYNGEDLVWHPVTPSMSSLSYQSSDASQNVELKRGNIASFFKPGASSKTAKASGSTSVPGITSSPHSSTQGQAAAVHAKDGRHARPDASSASELATEAHDFPGKHDECPDTGIQHGQPPSGHHLAGSQPEPGVTRPAGNHVVKEEPAEGDVLNTDDAGGIGALQLLHARVCLATIVEIMPKAMVHEGNHQVTFLQHICNSAYAAVCRGFIGSSSHCGCN